MDHTWNQGASLAPAMNEMTTGTPEEFLRRYPGAEELVVLLGAVQDVCEAWGTVPDGLPGDLILETMDPHMEAMGRALDAMKGSPARRSNAP